MTLTVDCALVTESVPVEHSRLLARESADPCGPRPFFPSRRSCIYGGTWGGAISSCSLLQCQSTSYKRRLRIYWLPLILVSTRIGCPLLATYAMFFSPTLLLDPTVGDQLIPRSSSQAVQFCIIRSRHLIRPGPITLRFFSVACRADLLRGMQ